MDFRKRLCQIGCILSFSILILILILIVLFYLLLIFNRNALGVYQIGILFVLIIILSFICLMSKCDIDNKNTVLESIKIEQKDIEKGQNELELIATFLTDNRKQITWMRGVLLGILVAISGYVLEKNLIEKKYSIFYLREELFFFLLSLVFLGFILELIIQVEQVCLTNRAYQLDKAINEWIIFPCSNELQQVFMGKEMIRFPKEKICEKIYSYCNMFIIAVKAPTFWVFYLIVLIYVYIMPWLLRSCHKHF